MEFGRLRIKAPIVAGQRQFQAFAQCSGERHIRVVGRIGRLGAPGDKNGDQIFRGVYFAKRCISSFTNELARAFGEQMMMSLRDP